MPNLKDKVALITGASSGIGAGTAIHFASLGCKLALNGRNEEKLSNVREQCLKTGLDSKNLILVPGDLNDEEVSVRVIEKTVDYFGSLDILVNNAGVFRPVACDNLGGISDFDLIMSTNFRTPYRMAVMSTPHLIKSKGNIVNVSSIGSIRNAAKLTPYGCSKSALDYMTRNLALELGPNQVRVNSVNPGAIVSDIFINMGVPQETYEAMLKDMAKYHALGRYGQPEEIAKPIAFLASDDASFITGAILIVDGGACTKSDINVEI